MILPRIVHGLPGSKPAFLEDGRIKVFCPYCGQLKTRKLTECEESLVLEYYNAGGHSPRGHVQDVFPGWTPDERETFLMSHVCAACWEGMFPKEDGDDA